MHSTNTASTNQPHPGTPAGQSTPGATVAGVPLQPGERVLYFSKPSRSADRFWTFVAGVVLLPVLIGIYFLYAGFNYAKTSTHYWIITNQRLFTVSATGRVFEQIRVHEITGLTHRRGSGTNTLMVQGAGGTIISFRMQESHDIARLKPFLERLRNPAFVEQAPSVPFEA